jgi:hypothetical protein
LIWTSLRIERYDEDEAEHTWRLELDGLEKFELMLPCSLLDIFRVCGITMIKVSSLALFKSVI